VKGLRVALRKPLARVLRAGHPWIFRDALAPFSAPAGAVATVVDARGRFVARGLVEEGPIGVRVMTTDDEAIDADLFARRIDVAAALRERVVPRETDAFRWLHGEGDRLPGFVCDVYGSHASAQLDGAAARAWWPTALELLRPRLSARGVGGVLVRSGRRGARSIELAYGDEPPAIVEVREHGLRLCASLREGQKTGLFLDHRESRRRVRELAEGARVLDLFAYVGGFSASAGLGGAARVTAVDVAAPAIAMARRTWGANDLRDDRFEAVAEDCLDFLARAAAERRAWDLVVCDPPSFAPNEASRARALEAYTRLHAASLRVLAPGGILLAASCSSHVDRVAFEGALAEAARSLRRVLQVLERWGAPADHPRLLGFPEGDYLKVVLVRAV
jgi:23S rRNA (cytosine1962-C5)-methyltransferase